MLKLDELVFFLDGFFAVYRFGDEAGGIFRPSTRRIGRIGLALEPWPGLSDWSRSVELDALFLHRPWQLAADQIAPDIGVFSYHLPFDERLALGYNPRLATALSLVALQELGQKEGRTIGMIGATARQPLGRYRRQLQSVFGGLDESRARVHGEIRRVAVVGAMTPELVFEAAERGAEVYVTGQYRQPAHAAVEATSIAVIAVGHRRGELWGLRALAGVLRERWSELEVVIAEPEAGV